MRGLQAHALLSEFCTVKVLEGTKICPLYGIAGCLYYRGYNVQLLIEIQSVPEQNEMSTFQRFGIVGLLTTHSYRVINSMFLLLVY